MKIEQLLNSYFKASHPLAALLAALKLIGIIKIAWVWIVAPLWLPHVMAVTIGLFSFLLSFLPEPKNE